MYPAMPCLVPTHLSGTTRVYDAMPYQNDSLSSSLNGPLIACAPAEIPHSLRYRPTRVIRNVRRNAYLTWGTDQAHTATISRQYRTLAYQATI
eukprot:2752546-Rhodomonas_salina.2